MLTIIRAEDPLTRARRLADRGYALLRFFGFLAAAVALTIVGAIVLTLAFGPQLDPDSPSLWPLVVSEAVLALLGAVLPAVLLGLLTREPLIRFGWGWPPKARQVLVGAAAGFSMMSLLIVSIAVLGAVHVHAPSLPPATVAGYGAGYALLFALVAIAEEGLLRGYALIQLSRAISFWPAAIITSLIFAALHLGNQDESTTGLVQVGLFGLLMAFSVRKTGGLWFALGVHASWDFTQTFIFGVPDSGMKSAGSLLTSSFDGPTWLTGGSVGPEGSFMVLLPLALLGVWISAIRVQAPEGESSSPD